MLNKLFRNTLVSLIAIILGVLLIYIIDKSKDGRETDLAFFSICL